MEKLLTNLEKIRQLAGELGLFVSAPTRVLTENERAEEMQHDYDFENGLVPELE